MWFNRVVKGIKHSMHRICGECTNEQICQEPDAQHMTKIFLNWNVTFTWPCRNIKAITQWFVETSLYVSRLNKCIKELIIYREQEFSFTTFAAHFKFPNLFLLFLLILKRFQKAFKTFLGCFMVWYEMFTTTLQYFNFSWPIKAWHFLSL